MPNMLTHQQIFDKVLTHLRRQGGPSNGRGGVRCLYRGPHGRSCAVGCLIADDDYRVAFEAGGAVGALIVRNADFHQALHNAGIDATYGTGQLLSELQKAHDASTDGPPSDERWLAEFESKMMGVAETHALTYTAPQ